jgi:predicted adenine nucleotide alpha hydrolase (AANH) superfamily ATPase
MRKKVYIAGKISGLEPEEYKLNFKAAADRLAVDGHKILNPCAIVPQDLDYEDQMAICMRLVEIADVVFMLENWRRSNGARREHAHAVILGKQIVYQEVYN